MSDHHQPSTTSSSLLFWSITGVTVLAIPLAAYYYWQWRVAKNGTPKALTKPDTFTPFPLLSKTRVTHNTSLYRFALPSSSMILGLGIGQHVQIRAVVDGQEVVRNYTPVSLSQTRGYFELLVKTYPQGRVSRFLDGLRIGEEAEMRGPRGSFQYRPNETRQLGMIAGGTGITPLLQVARTILENPRDRTCIKLLFANQTPGDILLGEELEELQQEYPGRFKVHHVVNEAENDASWTGSVGFVTRELIAEHLPGPSDDCRVLICGPPPMMNAMLENLQVLGFPPANVPSKPNDQVFRF